MKVTDVPVERNVVGESVDVVVSKHPSYGLINVSRINGNFSGLFATETDHNSAIEISIHYCQQTTSLGSNWYYGNKLVTRIQMSPIQYSEMITNPNASGVPCTIEYTENLGKIVYKPSTTLVDNTKEKLETLGDDILKDCRPIQNQINEILSQKGTLKKSDKEQIAKLVSSLTRKLHDNIPFYRDVLQENIDKMIHESKMDAENIITNVQNRLGSKLLDKPELIQMLLDDKTND